MFEDRSPKRTELAAFGEFALIDMLSQEVKLHQKSTQKGIGDDAAILHYPKDMRLLVSTDMLVEGIHFHLAYVPLRHLGYKAAMVNFSDMAAMNAVPRQITVNVGLSNRFSVEALQELYAGIRLACEKHQVDLVGGDTTSSRSGLIISITVLGYAAPKNICERGGAKDKDLIVCTGDLGAAYAGLLLLERERKVFEQTPEVQPDFSGYEYLLERQLKPEARIDIVQALQEHKIVPTSMIDISDGLASELLHICKASHLGCHLYENKLPVDHLTQQLAEAYNIPALTFALNGGEDYELLMTIQQSDYEKLKDDPRFVVIGYMMDEGTGAQLITTSDTTIPLQAQGWDSIKEREKES